MKAEFDGQLKEEAKLNLKILENLARVRLKNEDCPDYGKKDKGNMRVKERYGPKNRALLRCNTCTHCFSETKGTIFFGLETPDEEVLKTLAMIPEKGSIRATARTTGYDKDTICRWLDIARAHCLKVNDYFFQELELDQIQVDDIWSYIPTLETYKTAAAIRLPLKSQNTED